MALISSMKRKGKIISKIFHLRYSSNKMILCPFSSAFDQITGKKVAIKKLARPFQSAVHAKRTYRELRMLKHMNHENVSL